MLIFGNIFLPIVGGAANGLVSPPQLASTPIKRLRRGLINRGAVSITVSKSKKKTVKNKSTAGKSTNAPVETRAGESLTVFWAVTVLMVLVVNLVAIAAHFYLAANPAAKNIALLKGLLLFTGSLIGGVSLVVLPILYRIRKVTPPPGLAVFGACVAAAPILTVLVQALQE